MTENQEQIGVLKRDGLFERVAELEVENARLREAMERAIRDMIHAREPILDPDTGHMLSRVRSRLHSAIERACDNFLRNGGAINALQRTDGEVE